MPRTKLISDQAVLAIVRQRLLREGAKSVSFRLVSGASGLSPPALVLRFSSQTGMVSAALIAGWAELGAVAQQKGGDIGGSAKDLQAFLKAQADMADIPALLSYSHLFPAARDAAEVYREQIEAILTQHFGGGGKAARQAGLVFAAWQGRLAWAEAGGKSFRLGEFLRDFD